MMSGDRESSNLLGDGNERANNKNKIDNTNITKFTFHDEPNKIFSCDTCGMKFPVKHNYIRHLKIHDKPKETFNCDTCGMKFSVNLHGHPICSDERLI